MAALALLVLFCQARPALSAEAESPERLFEEAVALKEGDACDAAVPLFEEVARTAPGETGAFARYNAAVCLEGLGEPTAARDHYSELIALRALPDRLLVSALFRRALLDVVPGNDTRQARRDLSRARKMAGDRVERAQIDLQFARLDSVSGRDAAALRRVLRAGRVLDGAGDDAERDRRGAPLDWYRAEAAYIRGSLWASRARKVALGLRPRSRIVKRIEGKASALSEAEGHFAVAAGLPHPWAPRALLDLGVAWLAASEDLSGLLAEARMEAASAPQDAALAALVAWLEARAPAQYRKAMEAWSLCIESSRVLGMASGVAAQCQENLDALVSERGRSVENAASD